MVAVPFSQDYARPPSGMVPHRGFASGGLGVGVSAPDTESVCIAAGHPLMRRFGTWSRGNVDATTTLGSWRQSPTTRTSALAVVIEEQKTSGRP
jgi:hypothetical protein